MTSHSHQGKIVIIKPLVSFCDNMEFKNVYTLHLWHSRMQNAGWSFVLSAIWLTAFLGVIFGLLWAKITRIHPWIQMISAFHQTNVEILRTITVLVAIFVQLQTLDVLLAGAKKTKRNRTHVVKHRLVESCNIFIVKRGHSTMSWPWEGSTRGHVLSMIGASKRALSLCFFKHHSGWVGGVDHPGITLKDLYSRWSLKFVF